MYCLFNLVSIFLIAGPYKKYIVDKSYINENPLINGYISFFFNIVLIYIVIRKKM